ncbi:MAG: stage 0 sporulation protein [Anaerolineales bacterium]|nr:MAG: stage 0 sporulation protein [Anaerolineales bacterium]
MDNRDEVAGQASVGSELNLTAFNVVGVRFQPSGKLYHFTAASDLGLERYDWVVVETVYGEQVGQVMETDVVVPNDAESKKMRDVIREANGLDMARYTAMQERSERTLSVAREETRQNNIDLKIISAEFTLDGNYAIVVCTGNASKKDLATMRRRLALRMSCRVELRSVGPRDHAKTLCGYGVCGEERCCCRFLTDFHSVSIRMAKDQSISMAPSDITGMCGRLRCCLAYEHQVYIEESKLLPRLKSRVQTESGVGRVIDLDVLKGDVIVEIPPTVRAGSERGSDFPAPR